MNVVTVVIVGVVALAFTLLLASSTAKRRAAWRPAERPWCEDGQEYVTVHVVTSHRVPVYQRGVALPELDKALRQGKAQ